MSLLLAESAANSKPIELFTLARGADAWYFTSHDVDVVRSGVTYRASLASRDAFKQSEESDDIITSVRIAARHPLGEELLFYGLNNAYGPLYFSLSLTDEVETTEMWNVFFGQATDLAKHEAYAELTVKPSQNSLKRPMLRIVGGVQCNHVLYDSGCGVNMLDYEETVTITDASGGRIISVDPAPADSLPIVLRGGSYAGGFLQFGEQKWFIERNVLGGFVLMSAMSSSMVGEEVKIYKGCSRLYEICQSRFNNTRNFGGFPKWPIANPFDNAD